MRVLLANGESLQSLGDNLDLNGAAFHGHWRLCEFLIEQGADVNTPLPDTGETPLHAALCTPNRLAHDLVIRVLLAHGADPNRAQALAIVVLGFAMFTGASAGVASAQPTPTEPQLFAVEITVGPKWDQAKPPQGQHLFKEHSANLRRMRDAGVLIAGARYSDKGLLVVSAASVAEVRDQMAQDPSIGAGTFVYEVHPLNVFYPGELKTGPRR